MTTRSNPAKTPEAQALLHIRSDALAMAGDLGSPVAAREVAHAVSREHGYTLRPDQAEKILQGAGWRCERRGRRTVYHTPIAATSSGTPAADHPNPHLVAALAAELARPQRMALGGAVIRPDKAVVLTSPSWELLDGLRELGLCNAVGEGGDDFTYAALATPLGRAVSDQLCDERVAA